jgi:hypothetical protein
MQEVELLVRVGGDDGVSVHLFIRVCRLLVMACARAHEAA